MTRRDETLLAAAAGILLTALCYGRAVYAPLLWDDMDVVTPAGVRLTAADIPSFFTARHWLTVDPTRPRPYRPLRDTYLALIGDAAVAGRRLFGPPATPQDPGLRDPALADRVAWGYHAGNLALHALNAFLVYLLARRLALGREGAFAALGLFAVHPVHIEALVWVKNAAELLGLALMLAAMLSFLRAAAGRGAAGRWVMSIVLYLLAVLCKEAALPLPALLGLWAAVWLEGRARRRALAMTLPLWAVGLLFSAFQYAFVTATAAGGGGGGPPLLRLALCARTLMRYGAMALLPVRYVPLYGRYPPPVFNAWRAGLVVAAFAALGALLLVQTRRRSRTAFGAWWLFLALGPVSNLVGFNSARPVAEQRLYVPSVGLALFAAAIVSGSAASAPAAAPPFRKRRSFVSAAAMGVLAILFVALVLRGSGHWGRRLDFWRWAVRTAPERYMPYYNAGIMYAKAAERVRRGDPALAETFERMAETTYLHALWNHPHWGSITAANVCRNLANSLRRRGASAQAARFYRLGLAANPTDAVMHHALGWTFIHLQQKDRAVPHLRAARRLDATYAREVSAVLAQLHYDLKQYEQALVEVKRAIEAQPERAVLWRLAGDIYDALGDPDEAARHWARAEALRRHRAAGGRAP